MLLASPDENSPAIQEAIGKITSAVLASLTELQKRIASDLLPSYQGNLSADAAASTLQVNLDSVIEPVSEALESVLKDTAGRALAQLKISDPGTFGLVAKDALKWARERGAEMVGRRLVAGQLIENPDAEWAITDTTRNGIRRLLSSAYEDGLSPDELAESLQDAYEFSADRASMIARTETSKASVQGNLTAWKRSGVVAGKQWLLSGDHDMDDACDDNADDGIIPIDALFSSGVEAPPDHQHCNCVLAGALLEDMQDVEVDGE